jgi:hypothetical protein
MRYVISKDNRVQVLREGVPQPENADLVFSGSEELQAGTSGWTMGRLVLVWNKLPGCRPVARFENRRIALERLWRAIQNVPKRIRPPRSADASQAARPNKTELVISMLRAPEGATLDELVAATKWQAHSVRGFLSRKVSRDLGLPLQSYQRDGHRVYAVTPASAAGQHEPPPAA